MNALFVTLEGGEGTGKSTLAANLAEALEQAGLDVLTTREPGGTPLAEAIRDVVLRAPDEASVSSLCQAFLMNAARSDHLDQVIRPALQRGEIVICDRFSDSTRVYQGALGGVSEDDLLTLEDLAVGATRPDLTLILDADPEVLQSRRRQRGGPDDVFERKSVAFHQDLRARFLAIAAREPDRCVVLDATLSPDVLAEAALGLIQTRLAG